jgi:hypothetical protein
MPLLVISVHASGTLDQPWLGEAPACRALLALAGDAVVVAVMFGIGARNDGE